MAVQEVADSLGLARSALYAWVAQERDSQRPAGETLERALAGVSDEVNALVAQTDLLEMQVGRVGQLVTLMTALAVAPTSAGIDS